MIDDLSATMRFKLPDGSDLLLPSTGASSVAHDELETWSLVADGDVGDVTETHRGDPVAWSAALSAGALVVAAVQGIIGNAAWAAFPAAARFLQSMREGRPPRDAAAAADIARNAVMRINGGSVADDVVVERCERTPVGTWEVSLTKGTTRFAVVLDTTGAAIQVRIM